MSLDASFITVEIYHHPLAPYNNYELRIFWSGKNITKEEVPYDGTCGIKSTLFYDTLDDARDGAKILLQMVRARHTQPVWVETVS